MDLEQQLATIDFFFFIVVDMAIFNFFTSYIDENGVEVTADRPQGDPGGPTCGRGSWWTCCPHIPFGAIQLAVVCAEWAKFDFTSHDPPARCPPPSAGLASSAS